MLKVKQVFFLTDDEASRLRHETGDQYILNNMPHYAMEDGSILYSCGGVADYSTEVVVRKPVMDARSGDGTK